MTQNLTTDELLARYPHYYKDVRHLEVVDIYRVLELFGVTDPTVQHAVKKLMVPGKRGGKSVGKDLAEASDTLARGARMREEDLRKGSSTVVSQAPQVVTVVNHAHQPPTLSAELLDKLREAAPYAPPAPPPRDINRCTHDVCHSRRELGSVYCMAHQVPIPTPWQQTPLSAPPPPPPPPPGYAPAPAPEVLKAPEPLPLTHPPVSASSLALAVANQVEVSNNSREAKGPNALPRC